MLTDPQRFSASHAYAGGELSQAGHTGLPWRGPELSGEGAGHGTGADLFGGVAFGGKEGLVAAGGFAPLAVRAGDIDPVAGEASGSATTIAGGATLRAAAIIYAGVSISEDAAIGHYTLLRSHVTVGSGSQLAHHLTVERGSRIGEAVRCSPGSHITADTYIGDRVFLGAGVRTINDTELIWRAPAASTVAATIATGARVGSRVHHPGRRHRRRQCAGRGRIGGNPRRATKHCGLRCARPRPEGGIAVTDTRATRRWLTPFAAMLPQLRTEDWAWLHEFEAELITMVAAEPTHAGQACRAAWLLEVRRRLA